MLLIQKITEIENNTPDTTSFITNPGLNWFRKFGFDKRIKETVEKLATKTYGNNLLNLGDKNSENKKELQTLNSSYFKGRSHFLDDGLLYYYFD